VKCRRQVPCGVKSIVSHSFQWQSILAGFFPTRQKTENFTASDQRLRYIMQYYDAATGHQPIK